MKKNGKKYRKIQKERELRLQKGLEPGKEIYEEVEDINTDFLLMAHIIVHNPIVLDGLDVKKEYMRRLESYIRAGGWNRRKYESSQLRAYAKIILESPYLEEEHGIDFYQYYILFDIMHIMGYQMKELAPEKLDLLKKRYYADFPEAMAHKRLVNQIFRSVQGSGKKLKQLGENPLLCQETEYIRRIGENLAFKKKEPFRVMVTATMSAGKSTFINALTGKYICLSQNMACTSKIHCIVNKAFEDGHAYEYDHDLVMTAGREELLNDNEQNESDKIVVSTHFSGSLGKERIIVNDSPGVNFSGDEEHKIIAERLIKRRNYNLLIYVMNATQLATNDEDRHLDFVRRTVGRTPVIFVINKIDTFNVEEEDVVAAVKRQTEYLKKKGFKNPVVCPVSAKAAYLVKQFAGGKPGRAEKRELYNYIDKFEQMKLPEYYESMLHGMKVKDADTEEEQLLKTSGLAYVEKMIALLANGGKNGTSLREV